MLNLKQVFVVAVMLILAACGGGGSETGLNTSVSDSKLLAIKEVAAQEDITRQTKANANSGANQSPITKFEYSVPNNKPPFEFSYKIGISEQSWTQGRITQAITGKIATLRIQYSGEDKIIRSVERNFVVGSKASDFVLNYDYSRLICNINAAINNIQKISCNILPGLVELVADMHDGITAQYTGESNPQESSWKEDLPDNLPRGSILNVRFKNKEGILIDTVEFIIGTAKSVNGTNGVDKYIMGHMPSQFFSRDRFKIYAQIEGSTPKPEQNDVSFNWLGVFGSERTDQYNLYNGTVNADLKQKIRSSQGNFYQIAKAGNNIVTLSLKDNSTVMLGYKRGDKDIWKLTPLKDGSELNIKLAHEFDTVFGGLGSDEAAASDGIFGLSSQLYFQVQIKINNGSVRFRTVYPSGVDVSGCSDDGVCEFAATTGALREELRLTYQDNGITGGRGARMIQLAVITSSGNALSSPLPDIPENLGKMKESFEKLKGGLRIYVSQDDMNKDLFEGAANKVPGTGIKVHAFKQILRTIGYVTPDMWLLGSFVWTDPSPGKEKAASNENLMDELMNIPEITWPIEIPEWANNLNKITDAPSLRPFLNVDEFANKIPNIGYGRNFSPAKVFRSMTPKQKENIIKHVFDKAIEKTQSDNIVTVKGGKFNMATKLVQDKSETEAQYHTRLAGIIAGNVVLSLDEVFNDPDFWREVANETFGECTDSLKNYATRISAFINAAATGVGSVAAAIGTFLAGGVNGEDVPGYVAPSNFWNIDIDFPQGITVHYKTGEGEFKAARPQELAQGTSLTVKLLLGGESRTMQFSVGTAVNGSDLFPIDDAIELKASSTASTSGGVRIYKIKVEHKTYTMWNLGVDLESGITAQYKIGTGSFSSTKPASLAGGTKLTVMFTWANATRSEEFIVGTAEIKQDLFPIDDSKRLTVWSQDATVNGVKKYIIKAEHQTYTMWDLGVNLENGITAQYRIGTGAFSSTKPVSLAGGTKLTVKFTWNNATRFEEFNVGTAENKEDLFPNDVSKRLTVWSEVATVNGVKKYNIKAEHQTYIMWNVGVDLESGITAQYKIGTGAFSSTKPVSLAGGTKLTVKFTWGNATRFEEFNVGTAESKQDLLPNDDSKRLTVWSVVATVNGVKKYTIKAEHQTYAMWNVGIDFGSEITAQYQIGGGAFSNTKPVSLAAGTKLTVKFTIPNSEPREEIFYVGLAEVKHDLFPVDNTKKLTVWSTAIKSNGVNKYTISARKEILVMWKIGVDLESGTSAEYQVGNGAYSTKKPDSLAFGTSLRIKFKWGTNEPRVEAFVVGVAENKHDLYPNDVTKRLTVWSTADANSKNYAIKAEHQAYTYWNIATDFEPGISAQYKINDGNFSSTKPANLINGATLTVRFNWDAIGLREEKFVVGQSEGKKDLAPNDAAKRLTVWATAANGTGGRTFTISAENEIYTSWGISTSFESGITAQYKINGGVFSSIKPERLLNGTKLTVRFTWLPIGSRDEEFVVGVESDSWTDLTPVDDSRKLMVYARPYTTNGKFDFKIIANHDTTPSSALIINVDKNISATYQVNGGGYSNVKPGYLLNGTKLDIKYKWNHANIPDSVDSFVVGTARAKKVMFSSVADYKLDSWSTVGKLTGALSGVSSYTISTRKTDFPRWTLETAFANLSTLGGYEIIASADAELPYMNTGSFVKINLPFQQAGPLDHLFFVGTESQSWAQIRNNLVNLKSKNVITKVNQVNIYSYKLSSDVTNCESSAGTIC